MEIKKRDQTGRIGTFVGVDCELKHKPAKDEFVILKYDTENIDLNTLYHYSQQASQDFAPNKVIVLPNNIEMEYGDIEILASYRDMLDDIIKEKENA